VALVCVASVWMRKASGPPRRFVADKKGACSYGVSATTPSVKKRCSSKFPVLQEISRGGVKRTWIVSNGISPPLHSRRNALQSSRSTVCHTLLTAPARLPKHTTSYVEETFTKRSRPGNIRYPYRAPRVPSRLSRP